MSHCPVGCKGIAIGDGEWSGCDCSGDDGRLCDCPHHGCTDGCGHEAQIKKHEATIKAIVEWLEANQPDVFRRGLWDAIRITKES